MIIQKKNKEEYISEVAKYGNPPDLEDLQCLNLFIETIQQEVLINRLKNIMCKMYEIQEWEAWMNITRMSDHELRGRTVRDSGLIMIVAHEFGIKIPWSWLKIYLPRYKKTKKKIRKELKELNKWIKDYLLEKFNFERKHFV